MTDLFSTEGIILRAFPFHDHDRILSLFTPQEGLIKLYVKGAYLKQKNNGASSNPLNVVEVIYKKAKSEMHACSHIDVLNHHLSLRQELNRLNSACDMAKTILATQAPGKSAPKLYTLLLIYLKNLKVVKDPLLFSASFQLKTLNHEGLLSHHNLFPMTHEEQQMLEILTLCQDLSLLMPLSIDPLFATKIKDFFYKQL